MTVKEKMFSGNADKKMIEAEVEDTKNVQNLCEDFEKKTDRIALKARETKTQS